MCTTKAKGDENMKVGDKVKAYKGSCIGLLIQSTEWEGEITKINKNSIRVRLTESTSKFGSKTTSHWENLNTEKTFRFVKILSNGNAWYKSEANLYGGIEVRALRRHRDTKSGLQRQGRTAGKSWRLIRQRLREKRRG